MRLYPPVVAMIIPAGDASAFERFFHRLPLSLGVTYLVMEYYGAPVGRSTGKATEALPALLERATILPVRSLRQDTLLEKDAIYLLPPSSAIELHAGKLVFQGTVANGGSDYLADLFLASVATGTFGRCAAVLLADMAARVLSGLRVVRNEGGFTIVLDEQDPFMTPHPASRCPLVDLFLPATVAASKLTGLAEYFRHKGAYAQQDGHDTPTDRSTVFRLLKYAKGVDYSRYQQQDIVSRIYRRMAIHEIRRLELYTGFLEDEEDELTRLHDELQATVSGWYTETELETELVGTILPRMTAGQRSGPLRVWLPYCTGGHRAYAITMAIVEFLDQHRSDLSVQVFVTCWNSNSIARARKDIFENDEIMFLSRSRRKKFFTKKENHWQLSKTIREKCIFATHNLLKDSPFSHIDLVVESGAMTGFESDACSKAFRVFHFSLGQNGHLFMETLPPCAAPAEMFIPLEGARGIYTPKTVQGALNLDSPGPAPLLSRGEPEADELLLSGYVPASFLVDEQFRVIRSYGNTEPYLRAGRDKSSHYLFRIIRDELVFELNDLIEATDKDGRPVTRKGIQIGEDNQNREVSVEMIPLRPFGGNRRLIVIRETETAPSENRANPVYSSKERRLLAMEKEVQEMRGLLLASHQESSRTQEGLQRRNEDLQASNGEYLSLNKELRGLNEELTGTYNELLTRYKELNELNDGLRAHIREIHSVADAAMAIVSNIRRPIVVVRDDLRVHTANRAFLHLFEVTPEQTVGHYLHTVGPEVFHMDGVRARLQEVLTEGLEMDFEIRHRPAHQEEKVLHFSATRITRVPGLRSGILLTIDDVTEQRDLQRFKDELIGLASHELRTPATSIRAYSKLLAQELTHGSDGKSAFLVGKLNTQVDRLTGLTRDLLDVSRISRGRIVLEENTFDINGLIDEIAAEMRLTTAVPISIEPQAPSPPFHGDRERIGRVLRNLLSNAIKYSSNTEQIGIRTVVTKENVHLYIRLSGTGMPVEQIRKLIEHDGASHHVVTTVIPDISLGLYISSEIVRIHGGTISVVSEKNEGSAFSIVLPFDKKRVAVSAV